MCNLLYKEQKQGLCRSKRSTLIILHELYECGALTQGYMLQLKGYLSEPAALYLRVCSEVGLVLLLGCLRAEGYKEGKVDTQQGPVFSLFHLFSKTFKEFGFMTNVGQSTSYPQRTSLLYNKFILPYPNVKTCQTGTRTHAYSPRHSRVYQKPWLAALTHSRFAISMKSILHCSV